MDEMVNCDFDSQSSVSRRKLVLKVEVKQSDLSKAVVLYQPPDKNIVIGRSLTACDINLREEQIFSKSSQAGHIFFSTNPEDQKRAPFSWKQILFVLVIIYMLLLTGWQTNTSHDPNCDCHSGIVDFSFLKDTLKKRLYGQEIAARTIIDELEQLQVTVTWKSIALLFGPSGTGKTWTTRLISSSLPVNAKQIKIHLDLKSPLEIEGILNSISCCHFTFVLIEDSDFANQHQIGALVKWLAVNRTSRYPSSQKLFILLTSNFAELQVYEAFLKNNHRNRSFSGASLLADAERSNSLLVSSMDAAGLEFTPIPYFPLEKNHVELCVRDDLMAKSKWPTTQQTLARILENIRFLPPGLDHYAASGCKNVATQVNLYS